MATIHVNTDLMRQLGRLFYQLNAQIETQLQPQIQHSIAQLEGDWVGVSREHFEALLDDWRVTAIRLAENGEQIGNHLEMTADNFDNADRS